MSTFNPDMFLNTEVSSANDTAYIPVAEGEFIGSIKKIAPRVLNDGRAVLDVTWVVDDETTRQETGIAEPTVRRTIWLDLNESGSLDFGKGPRPLGGSDLVKLVAPDAVENVHAPVIAAAAGLGKARGRRVPARSGLTGPRACRPLALGSGPIGHLASA